MNWIEVKKAFSLLNRLGATSVTFPPHKLRQLEMLVEKNTDIGGPVAAPEIYLPQEKRMMAFFGVRIEIE